MTTEMNDHDSQYIIDRHHDYLKNLQSSKKRIPIVQQRR